MSVSDPKRTSFSLIRSRRIISKKRREETLPHWIAAEKISYQK